ncbi:cyclopropane fatty acyl phospholipid synthase [Pokkaliibacter sp. CJK22405]|uniref:cyclopropane fatty acyl phospholipid synthase n=1 Tax=Pokkaliibacter sp. CJK22405 TaxID=3384615 RepID=UPI003984B1B7
MAASAEQLEKGIDAAATASSSSTTANHAGTRKTSTQQMEKWLASQLEMAGITLNGPNSWDPQVRNPDVYYRVFREGTLGIGEAYMDGWWECEQLDELISRAVSAQLEKKLTGRWVFVKHWLMARMFNMQSVRRAFQVGEQHYDAGNDLYQAMLDETMAYSCGYWNSADNLHEAQKAKLDLICRKAQLKPGENVLEIGCGWGSFAELAARDYGVNVTGITISKEQKALADERCAGLPVNIELMDYRSLEGQFDKLVSIGMFEHVGQKNYDTYLSSAHRLMKDDGIFVLHTIGSDTSQLGTDPWIHKYIFRNGAIPSLGQISDACEPYFVMEDVHNFGPDYDRTLMAWFERFEAAWPQLKDQYDERFYRMWTYYLKSCAGAFRARSLQLYQVVLRKRQQPMSRYHSPR